MFEETFLDRSELQKFQMLTTIRRHPFQDFTINSLSQTLGFSYQQGYNILQELFRDMAVLSHEPEKLSKRQLTSLTDLDVSIDQYRLFLLEDAIPFQFVNYIVQMPNPVLDQFCQAHFISRSTLLRKTRALRELLEQHGLKLSLSKQAIIGRESHIRLFLFYFYWWGYHGVRWPFTVIDEHKVHQEYSQLETASHDPVVVLRECLYWAISRIRMGLGFTIDARAFRQLFDDFEPFNQRIYRPTAFPGVSAKVRHAEDRFFHFFQNYAIRFTADEVDNEPLSAFLLQSDSVVGEFSRRLLTFLKGQLKPHCDFSFEAHPQLVLNLVRVILNHHLLGTKFIGSLTYAQATNITVRHPDPTTSQPLFYQALVAFTQTLPQTDDFQRLLGEGSNLLPTIYELLFPHLRAFKLVEPVKIKFLITGGNMLNLEMMDLLADLKDVKILTDEYDFSDADLIISGTDDSNLLSKQDLSGFSGSIFTWTVDQDNLALYQLYLKIKTIFFHKLATSAAQETLS